MKKETAIEWLIGELNGYDEDCEIFRIAKAMEREQIELAFDEGSEYEYQYHINGDYRKEASTYYNETYGGDNV